MIPVMAVLDDPVALMAMLQQEIVLYIYNYPHWHVLSMDMDTEFAHLPYLSLHPSWHNWCVYNGRFTV